MRSAIKFILLLVVAIAVGFWLNTTTGLVMLITGDTRFTVTLPVFLITIFILFIVLYVVLRLLAFVARVPKRVQQWSINRTLKKNNRLLIKGYHELFALNNDRDLVRLVQELPQNEYKAMAAVAVARIAHYREQEQKRDEYLQLALQLDPSLEMLIHRLQLIWFLDSHQGHRAITHLDALLRQDNARKDLELQQLQLRLLTQLNEMDTIEYTTLLRKLLRKGYIDEDKGYRLLESNLSLRLMHASDDDWYGLWRSLSNQEQLLPQVAIAAAKRFTQQDQANKATVALQHSLDHHYDEQVLLAFADSPSSELTQRLGYIQKALKQVKDNPDLWNTGAYLCLLGGLWGQAEMYLKTALNLREDERVHALLASLYDQTGQVQQALEHWRKATALSVVLPTSHQKVGLLPVADTTQDPTSQPDEKSLTNPEERFFT